jgi:hypothetical protein
MTAMTASLVLPSATGIFGSPLMVRSETAMRDSISIAIRGAGIVTTSND